MCYTYEEPVPVGGTPPPPANTTFTARFYTHTLGKKEYEITNHASAPLSASLGNVLATVLDRKTGVKASPTATTYAWFKADVSTAQDYYPFGSLMPGRTYVAPTGAGYRFGFNGQQRDDEIVGAGNSMSAEFWQYDARLGKRWNVDPVIKPFESSFAAFGNNPIWFTDVKGNDTTIYMTSYIERTEYNKDGQRVDSKIPFLDKEKVMEIGKYVQDIYKKNNLNVKIEFVEPDKVPSLALDKTDAYINIAGGMLPDETRMSLSTGEINLDRTQVNYEKYSTGNREYLTAYAAAHETLHQFSVRAEIFHFGASDLPEHDNSVPNLNMSGRALQNSGASPTKPSISLQRAERILFEQQRMIYFFFQNSK